MTMPTPDAPTMTILLVFSPDELALIVQRLGLSQLPGFTPPETFDAAAAEQSLREREILSDDEAGNWQINEGVLTILLATAQCEKLLSLTIAGSSPQEQHWLAFKSGYMVHLSRPQPNLYRYQIIDTGEKLALLFAVILRLDTIIEEVTDIAATTIPLDPYHTARQLAKAGQIAKARQQLASINTDPAVITAVVQPEQATVLALLRFGHAEIIEQRGMAVAQTDHLGWLIFPSGENAMLVQPAGQQDILNALVEFVS